MTREHPEDGQASHLAFLVSQVHLVDLVYLVSFIQPNKRDKPNKPNEQDGLVDVFSILLETVAGSDGQCVVRSPVG